MTRPKRMVVFLPLDLGAEVHLLGMSDSEATTTAMNLRAVFGANLRTVGHDTWADAPRELRVSLPMTTVVGLARTHLDALDWTHGVVGVWEH